MIPIFLALPVMAAEEIEHRGPTDAAPSGAVPYRSVFEDYQSLRDAGVKSWRAVNEALGQSSGHTGHSTPGAPPADERRPDAESQSMSMGIGADHSKH